MGDLTATTKHHLDLCDLETLEHLPKIEDLYEHGDVKGAFGVFEPAIPCQRSGDRSYGYSFIWNGFNHVRSNGLKRGVVEPAIVPEEDGFAIARGHFGD